MPTARSIVEGAPWTTELVEVGLELDPRPVAARALDRVGGDQVEAHVSGRLGHRLGPGLAGELDQLADQGGHLVDLLDEVVQQLLARLRRQLVPAREDLDVRLQAGERRAQLVRGVGHELPLRPARVLERAEHRVEARRQPAELVVAGRGRLDPLREIPRLGDRFRRRGQPAHGRQRGARDQQAERGRDRRSRPAAIRIRKSVIRCSVRVTSVSGRAICTA